jgi:hypothetical protein
MYDLYGNEYTVLGKYMTSYKKILVRHNECGYEWETVPTVILSQETCPNCKLSKKEKAIRTYFNKIGIKFTEQKKFEGLYYKSKKSLLKFDFCLLTKDNKNILLEYDGEFHYLNIFGEDVLKSQQERDKLKDDYCKEHKIKLYRISYKENLEERLNEIIEENKDILLIED